MTRDIDWGIPVPVEGYPPETKRIYVWFDAVIGYLSAAVEWAHNEGEPDAWRAWWQNPDSAHSYFMGKDNIVFHTVIWPSMLLGYGQGGELGAEQGELHLPDEVVASEFLDDGGQAAIDEPCSCDLRARRARALRPGSRFAISSPPRGRRLRTAISPGLSFSAETTTSCSPTGAISSTARSPTRFATSTRSRSQGSSAAATGKRLSISRPVSTRSGS